MNQKFFKTRIRKSIADQNLQIALDNNARRRTEGRLAAFASLPDHQERRQRAHAIKAEVVAHLDEYLDRFIDRVTANGIQVHRAVNASEALNIFMEIAQQHKARLVAKAKTMISEEINFNHALEAAGLQVVETDLGEYIVQLRGERPSHIITPAVHLRRADVGKLFEQKLGIPYTEHIPTLTNTARAVLRQVFLTADIGISGVNFGVVDTGTLCVVTNEGNGRMCTTIPPVHVAMMGIERLVPTLDDLALFLSLLPRSATGQKLSVYTSLINAPVSTEKRLSSTSQERHLILLDNGRSSLRSSPLAESLYCIRCGACLNACPVFREIGGHAYGSIYPGPIGSVISCALVDPSFALLAQASSLCGACKEACPVDIDLPGMLISVRTGKIPGAGGRKGRTGIGVPLPLRIGLKGYGLAAGNSRLFSFFQGLGSLVTQVFITRSGYLPLPAWTGWGLSKDFPPLVRRTFRKRWKSVEQELTEDGGQVGSEIGNPEADPVDSPVTTSLVERFTVELNALGGSVHLVTEEELNDRLTEFLKSRDIDCVMTDESSAHYINGVSILRSPDPTIRAGVTGALCGIAGTGSLLVISGEGQLLTASLLPEIHVVIIKASRLVPTLTEAMRMPEIRTAQSGVIITGPSRTADIEMTLTIGVHGPGEIHVFLIDDSSSV